MRGWSLLFADAGSSADAGFRVERIGLEPVGLVCHSTSDHRQQHFGFYNC
jgi:hypothetical protein